MRCAKHSIRRNELKNMTKSEKNVAFRRILRWSWCLSRSRLLFFFSFVLHYFYPQQWDRWTVFLLGKKLLLLVQSIQSKNDLFAFLPIYGLWYFFFSFFSFHNIFVSLFKTCCNGETEWLNGRLHRKLLLGLSLMFLYLCKSSNNNEKNYFLLFFPLLSGNDQELATKMQWTRNNINK